MQPIHKLALIAFLALFAAGCSNMEVRPGDTVTFEAGGHRYYSWRSQPLENTINSTDLIYVLDPVLRREFDAAMAERGYRLDPDQATFSVDYIYAQGLRMGEQSRNSSNLSTHPGAIPNRNMDQASVDNAYALAGVKETSNIGIQFNDIESNQEIWRVVITRIIEDSTRTDYSGIEGVINRAMRQAVRNLPKLD